MFTYATAEQVVEAGERFQRAEYWQSVRSIAEEVLRQFPNDEEAQDEHVHQFVDGSEWVIYCRLNLSVLRFTENDDAYEDVGGIPVGAGAYDVYQFVAFWAMRADVMNALAELRDHGSD